MNIGSFFDIPHMQELNAETIAHFNTNSTVHVEVLSSALPYWIASLTKTSKSPMMVLASKYDRAQHIYRELNEWSEGFFDIYMLPEIEVLPFERQLLDNSTIQSRIRTLAKLAGINVGSPAKTPIIVTSLRAITENTIDATLLKRISSIINVGDKIPILDFVKQCQDLGYTHYESVDRYGTVSRRGGIVDIFSPSEDLPVRIEFFGDVIESLRTFDPVSQISIDNIKQTLILPAQEVLPSQISKKDLDKLSTSLDVSGCKPDIASKVEEDIAMLLHGNIPLDCSLYGGSLSGGSVLDYLPENGILIVERFGELELEGEGLDKSDQEIRISKELRGELPLNLAPIRKNWLQTKAEIEKVNHRLLVSNWINDFTADSNSNKSIYSFSPCKDYIGNFDVLANDIKNWQSVGDEIMLVSLHASRVRDLLSEHNVVISTPLNQNATSVTSVIFGSLSEGWTLSIGDYKLHLITDKELMGHKKERPMVKRSEAQKESFLSELRPGDYLVHVDHGIGYFKATSFIYQGNVEREYLEIEYAEGDKLFVPTDQLDRVASYLAPGDKKPALTRLNTREWARHKAKATESTAALAEHLLSLYAVRELSDGICFSKDTPWQTEMEDYFSYSETPDQMKSINDVKSDMELNKPMDRLICGDVGYGKTEVAIRAAFKAIMDGVQVAFLAPTTVLAQQHYETLIKRFTPYPINIEVLSRFRNPKDQKLIVEGISSGKVDICIGTHRLLQKDVSFKNLGLIIVDEEQRFGVSHKERLRSLGTRADLLTLTATPIPRTLHMALTGIKDMSTIETPPEERLSIKTYVSEYSEEIIRQAILREIERGGQIFFLHNKVKTILSTAAKINQIVPSAKISIAHGQMSERELEKAMFTFSNQESDVLVCTTIIEAGLDMPNVNTLIVERADTFGLSQLYQLRGRVGRSSNRAYTYFLIPEHGQVSSIAEKRLKTILAATELGSGFRIAMRDLEIRGAGNLLGAAQSGHIQAIGYDLYSKLLNQAVKDLAGQGVIGTGSIESTFWKDRVSISLPMSSFIPSYYIPDLTTRLAMYQRLANNLNINQLDDLLSEMCDRFGSPPKEVMDLLYYIRLKIATIESEVASISYSNDSEIIKIQLRHSVGGAKSLLQKKLGIEVKLGDKQISLVRNGNWQDTLLNTINVLVSFEQDFVNSKLA